MVVSSPKHSYKYAQIPPPIQLHQHNAKIPLLILQNQNHSPNSQPPPNTATLFITHSLLLLPDLHNNAPPNLTLNASTLCFLNISNAFHHRSTEQAAGSTPILLRPRTLPASVPAHPLALPGARQHAPRHGPSRAQGQPGPHPPDLQVPAHAVQRRRRRHEQAAALRAARLH